MISFLETIAFTFLAALIRNYIPNDRIILVVICVLAYTIVFRDYNKTNNSII